MAEWSIATVCKTVAFMALQVRILLRPPRLNFQEFCRPIRPREARQRTELTARFPSIPRLRRAGTRQIGRSGGQKVCLPRRLQRRQGRGFESERPPGIFARPCLPTGKLVFAASFFAAAIFRANEVGAPPLNFFLQRLPRFFNRKWQSQKFFASRIMLNENPFNFFFAQIQF